MRIKFESTLAITELKLSTLVSNVHTVDKHIRILPDLLSLFDNRLVRSVSL